jgi:phenylacetate-CoA ligase
LPDYLILDPKVDRMPHAQLRELQSGRLREMVRYCYEATPFWRRKFDTAGIKPEDIHTVDDLPKMPFCTKAELQADQTEHPPFGSYAGTSRSQWRKFATTSGTTGVPLKRVFSERDWRYVLDRFRRNPTVTPGDVVIVLGPVDGLMGPMGSAESLAAMGAMVVLAGLYDTKTKIRLIEELRPALVSGTASYLFHVAETAREMHVNLPSLGIRSIASVGEPGAAVPETRKRLLEAWGAQQIADGYGLTELFPLGGSCPFNPAIHIASDLAYTEIVDPKTGAPVSSGAVGEIVYTNLVGDTQPLLRYRTRDLGRLSTAESCACGHTGARLEGSILGRVDDMIWYRGANIFPSAIEAAVRRIPELGPEYQIEISGDGALPMLTVRAEASTEGLAEGAINSLRTRLEESVHEAIRVNAHVEVVAPRALPRPDGRGKVRRIIDRRVR